MIAFVSMNDVTPEPPCPSFQPSKLWTLAGAGLLAVMAVYSVFWWIISERAVAALDLWVQKQQRAGYTVQWDRLSVSGYPFRIVARLDNPRVERTNGSRATEGLEWSWAIDSLLLSGRPWQWRRLHIEAPGRHTVVFSETGDGSERTVSLDADSFLADARFKGRRWAWIKIAGAGLTVSEKERIISELDSLSTELGREFAADADERTKTGTATIEFQGLDVPVLEEELVQVAGSVIRHAILEVEIYGPLPDDWSSLALSRWRDAGGVAEIRKALAEYGPLRMDADGTLAMDRQLQPIGSFVARLEGYAKAIDAIRSAGLMTDGDALTAKLVLGAMAEKDAATGVNHLSIPINVQGGVLYAGPLALTKVPPIVW